MIWLLVLAFLASLSASAPVAAQGVGGPGGNPNNPIAPNQPCPDDSNRIANTHFVHECGGGGGGGGLIPLGLGFTITPGEDNPTAGALATPLVIGTNTLYGQIDPIPLSVDTTLTAPMMGHNIKAMAGVSIAFTLPQAGTTGFEKGVSACFVAQGSGGLTLTSIVSALHGVPVSSNIMSSDQYGNGCAASDGTDWDVSWSFPSGTGSVTTITEGSHITLTPNPITSSGIVAFSQMATNTVVANPTSGTANAQDLAVPSCSADHEALQWLTNTGFQCPTDFAQFDKNQTWTKNQAMPPTILVPGITIAWNGLDRNYYKVTLDANNETLGAGTNVQPGNYTWFIYTGAGFTGFSTDASFKWIGGTPVWSTAAGKEDVISCLVDDALVMACFAGIDVGGSGGGLSLTSAHIYVGNSSNVATDVAVSGVLTLANTGAFSFASSTGSGAVVLASGPSIATPTITGSFTATGLVTYADIQNVAAVSLLGNPTGGATAVSGITLGSGLSFSGTTLVATGSGGTVTSVACGAGLSCSPSPIVGAGTASLDLTHVNTWTGQQDFARGKFVLDGTTGTMTLQAAATAGTNTITLPAGTTDFSGTGGTSQVVKQVTTGAALTVARLACADLSDAGAGCTGAAGSGVVSAGTAGQLGYYATTSSTISGNANATISNGALTLGVTSGPVAGSLTMWGSTSGSLQVKPAAAAGTSSVLTLPGGTTDFSATGGTNNVVKQASAGAALTVGTLACANLSDGATGCSTATGTSGATIPLLNGTNTFSGTQTFGAVVGGTSIQSGTSYTLAATDCGTTINFTSGSAITLTTLNSLPIGCGIAILQAGAGQITVANGASATMNSTHSYTKTFGQWATIGLYVDTNAGSAAHFVLTGDGA